MEDIKLLFIASYFYWASLICCVSSTYILVLRYWGEKLEIPQKDLVKHTSNHPRLVRILILFFSVYKLSDYSDSDQVWNIIRIFSLIALGLASIAMFILLIFVNIFISVVSIILTLIGIQYVYHDISSFISQYKSPDK